MPRDAYLAFGSAESARVREEESYSRSLAVLKICTRAVHSAQAAEHRTTLCENLSNTFDAQMVPSELVRSALASLLARFSPEAVVRDIERFRIEDPALAQFTIKRLTWNAPRIIAEHLSELSARFDLPVPGLLEIASVAARRDPTGTIEFVPTYGLGREDLFSILKLYVSIDTSALPYLLSLKTAAGAPKTALELSERIALATRTIDHGGAGTFLFYFNTFFPEPGSSSNPVTTSLIDRALTTRAGREFFLEHGLVGRLSDALVKYVTNTHTIDFQSRSITRNDEEVA